MNPVALLWMLLAFPAFAMAELASVVVDRRALRRNGMLTAISRRHYERAIGRLVLLFLVIAIGAASLSSPFTAPTTPRGWLILAGLLLIPTLIQVDGIRDRQLRNRVMRGQRPHA